MILWYNKTGFFIWKNRVNFNSCFITVDIFTNRKAWSVKRSGKGKLSMYVLCFCLHFERSTSCFHTACGASVICISESKLSADLFPVITTLRLTALCTFHLRHCHVTTRLVHKSLTRCAPQIEPPNSPLYVALKIENNVQVKYLCLVSYWHRRVDK